MAVVALGDEDVCKEAVSASVGRRSYMMGGAGDLHLELTQGPRTHRVAVTSASRAHHALVYHDDSHDPQSAALRPRKTVSKEA